ncbi:MAG: PQQ-binding-like beta-propeller repeat protein [Thermoanaerobaculia bacterium]|nr:PQQ-binding-like beta-propeller repeat protein [Thermoanaerobaculia bacterium]
MIHDTSRARRRAAATAAAFLLLVTAASAADTNWPQWRGPDATGAAPAGDPPVKWSEKKNVRWKVPIGGLGSSSPIVWGDLVFVTTAVDTGERAAAKGEDTRPEAEQAANPLGAPPEEILSFEVVAFSRADGSEVWRTSVIEEQPHEGRHPTGTYASGSPVTDGERLYVSFGSRGVYALDFEGNVLWSRDFGDMTIRYGFGEGASPTLYRDSLVLNWDHEGDSFIVALDTATGEERWRVPRDEMTSWTTPLVVEVDGRAQVITSATEKVRAYDFETGDEIWTATGMTLNAIPSPMYQDGVAYLTSGFRGNAMLAIELSGAKGDITGTDHIKWSLDRDTPYVPSALLYKDRIYFLKLNNPILTVVDADSGKTVYGPERLSGLRNVYASPVAAADRVYFVGRKGEAVVIRHGDELDILAENQLDDAFDASPAIAGDEIYLRGAEHLYCIAKR